MSDSLGTFIRERRQDLGLTQEQLAERIGDTVCQAEVSRLENNRISLPRRERLTAIAVALEVSLGDLLVKTGWMEEGDDLAEAILMPPRAGWAAAELEDIGSIPTLALVEAVTTAEANVVETAAALEQAQEALTTLRRIVQHIYSALGEIRPRIGAVEDWESVAVFYGP
jgi:transcriptional regulator with XRE-family HTH domain